MRSYHNISDYVRVCVNDCVVNGIEIKKGVWIHFPIFASHFDPDFFPEPDTYCPEEFLEKKCRSNLSLHMEAFWIWKQIMYRETVCIRPDENYCSQILF